LGHLLTSSGLTHPEVSSMVFLGSLSLLECSFYQSGNLLRGIRFTSYFDKASRVGKWKRSDVSARVWRQVFNGVPESLMKHLELGLVDFNFYPFTDISFLVYVFELNNCSS
jgi:hypothetical protein